MSKTITVTYKFVDGAHFFVSDEAKGLCAASADLKMAFDDVSVQLKTLAKLNHGRDINYVPAISFDAFLKELVCAIEAEISRRSAQRKAATKRAPKSAPKSMVAAVPQDQMVTWAMAA